MADSLPDIIHVSYGAAVTFGVDLDAVLGVVHRSHMRRLEEHGKPVMAMAGGGLPVIRPVTGQPPRAASPGDGL